MSTTEVVLLVAVLLPGVVLEAVLEAFRLPVVGLAVAHEEDPAAVVQCSVVVLGLAQALVHKALLEVL